MKLLCRRCGRKTLHAATVIPYKHPLAIVLRNGDRILIGNHAVHRCAECGAEWHKKDWTVFDTRRP